MSCGKPVEKARVRIDVNRSRSLCASKTIAYKQQSVPRDGLPSSTCFEFRVATLPAVTTMIHKPWR